MKTYENTSVQTYNSFHIAAQADRITIFESKEEAQNYFQESSNSDILKFVIGGGSNLLFTSNFKGELLKMENKGIHIIDERNAYVWVKVAAGENWDDVVSWAVEKGYGGIENLSLIPGTMGAAPVQNIGAYGVEFKDVFNSLEAIDIKTGELRNFYFLELDFDYRYSIFKGELKDRFIITSVVIKLNKYPKLQLDYGQLKKEAKEISGKTNPDIADVRAAVIKIRESKLPNPDEIPNAGSFFKNPVVDKKTFRQLKDKYPQIAYYDLENNTYKIAAAWLIEKAGLKGFNIGNVSTHPQHALIIVNNGNASGSEVWSFAKHIQAKVRDQFSIELQAEVMTI